MLKNGFLLGLNRYEIIHNAFCNSRDITTFITSISTTSNQQYFLFENQQDMLNYTAKENI